MVAMVTARLWSDWWVFSAHPGRSLILPQKLPLKAFLSRRLDLVGHVCVRFDRLGEKRPVSRSVVGARLGRLIWAGAAPARRTSSLCSTAPTEAGCWFLEPVHTNPPAVHHRPKQNRKAASALGGSSGGMLTPVIQMVPNAKMLKPRR